jgi:pilus assembly protein Flp/PilA
VEREQGVALEMQTLKHWTPKRQACGDAVLRFVRDERGTTSIEYGLIAALVAVGMLIGLRALGTGNSSSWGSTSNAIANAMK